MTQHPDFKAKLFFFPTEQSGRKNPVRSGYRPQIKFNNYPEISTSGKQIYLDREIVNLGEKVIANIEIFSVGYFSKRLFVGMDFFFYEGKSEIGKGKIIEILNSELKLENNTTEYEINLNLYPKIIQEKLNIFGVDRYKIVCELQNLIKLRAEFRNSKLIQSILYLIIEKKQKRNEIYERVKSNWKDIIIEAETT